MSKFEILAAIIGVMLVAYLAVRMRRFERLAFTDTLTTLPNRAALTSQLEQAVAKSARTSRLTAVIFLDLDNFKAVNDKLGHPFGDRLLSQAARRLASGVRDGDTIARFGGDEFVVIANNLRRSKDAKRVYKRLATLMKRPFRVGVHEIQLGASAGIALSKNGVHSPDELIHNADQALYLAKAAGRGAMRIFNQRLTKTRSIAQ